MPFSSILSKAASLEVEGVSPCAGWLESLGRLGVLQGLNLLNGNLAAYEEGGIVQFGGLACHN